MSDMKDSERDSERERERERERGCSGRSKLNFGMIFPQLLLR